MSSDYHQLIGSSSVVQRLDQAIESAASSDAKVLIVGESGVGKEIVARLIHARSRRRVAPMITMNCASVPDTLLESEMFGHLRGSFTGAYRDRPGVLQVAHRGTLFMDEVGEMSLRMQGLLLRFLETGEIQRVGDTRIEPKVDVRVIAATNRNLAEQLASKSFREDLYYRLNVIHIVVPPLRERTEDVVPLLEHFLTMFARQYQILKPEVTPEARQCLVEYRWPGNVRELRNFVERLMVTAPGRLVTVDDLPSEVQHHPIIARTARPVRRSVADEVFDQMVNGRESFWSVVYGPFMSRDMTRDDLRQIVAKGLEQTSGSYKILVQLFNMEPNDYKRVLNFLRKHNCHMPFQRFRNAPSRPEAARVAHSSGASAA